MSTGIVSLTLGSSLGLVPGNTFTVSGITGTGSAASANGTFVDHAERTAVEAPSGAVPTIFPKVSLGDAFGASALMQIICAVQSLRREPAGSVLAPVIGLNQQAAAALISSRR